MSWSAKLTETGFAKGGEALHADGIKRISGSDQTVTDVTAAELKELIGGYFLVKAANVDEATKIAANFPDYDLDGTVKVREVIVFE
ncbi:MAG: YciI family protein [Flavobacteriales bacterium]|nr:YciI family protein [Flavobacteriales bacterium]